MAIHSICHIEIMSKNPARAADFYGRLFGWKLYHDMGERYILFQPESGIGGGIQKTDNFAPGTGVIFYVIVDDISVGLNRAAELGGRQTVTRTEIPGVGWFGQFTDLDGNLVGLFTSK